MIKTKQQNDQNKKQSHFSLSKICAFYIMTGKKNKNEKVGMF
jgi:hypothetical protein